MVVTRAHGGSYKDTWWQLHAGHKPGESWKISKRRERASDPHSLRVMLIVMLSFYYGPKDSPAEPLTSFLCLHVQQCKQVLS